MYPITIFVKSDGKRIAASKTDQHHWSFEKFKHVRTHNGKLCVSAGMWDISQLRWLPFRDACEEARLECEKMERRGHTVMTPRAKICDNEKFAEYLTSGKHRPKSEKSLKALKLVVVEGFDFTNAARVCGYRRPETNGRIRVKRMVKAFSKWASEESISCPSPSPIVEIIRR
jgi:hypothetical protein